MEDLCQRAFLDFAAAVVGDDGDDTLFGMPPEFVAATSLSVELNSQPAKSSSEFALGHSG